MFLTECLRVYIEAAGARRRPLIPEPPEPVPSKLSFMFLHDD